MSALEERPDVEVVLSLDELAATINGEHARVGKFFAGMVEHAIRAGDALWEVRTQMETDEFRDWCSQHIAASRALVNIYMRISRYPDLARQARGLEEARMLLRGLPAVAPSGRPRIHANKDHEIQKLTADGLSVREVSEILGLPRKVVQRGRNPDLQRENDRKWAAKAQAAKVQREAERNALIVLQRIAAAKKIGGDIGEAYSLCRRLSQVLDAIHRDESEQTDTKRIAGLAYNECTAVEGYLNQLLGVG